VVPAPPHHGVGSFSAWVAESCSAGSRVLNVGAGTNRSGELHAVTRRPPYLVGVDPDPSVLDNPSLHERHQMSLEEFASDHEEQFDVAFAVYVLEHVSAPDAFVTSCARLLRPGGRFFALTLNMHQSFGLVTWAASRTGTCDRLLSLLKPGHVIERYHFPTEYRLNSIRTVSGHLRAAGFRAVEFRCYDDARRYQWYLPAGARWLAPAYSRLAYAVGSPELMGHLSFRAVK
jgi:2-polyprenyl-3-methyl-5-hydroxy-6-metoxy-1,4-benzoquinol methylase